MLELGPFLLTFQMALITTVVLLVLGEFEQRGGGNLGRAVRSIDNSKEMDESWEK